MTYFNLFSSRTARRNTDVGRRCCQDDRSAALRPQNGFSAGTPAKIPVGVIPLRSRQGSALLLTLVCLVMMVLLGTAYVQVARVDRRATRQIVGVDNMATVRDAVLEYIGEVLKKDVVGPGANVDDPSDDTLMYNNSAADSSHFTYLNGYTPLGGNIIEGYDYPYTNRNVTYPVTAADGSPLGDAIGGVQDDTWLAAAALEERFVPLTAWTHISNMNGVFLRIPKQSSGFTLPLELRTTSSTTVSNPASDGGSDGNGGWTNTTGFVVGGHNGSTYILQSNANSLDHNHFQYERPGIDVDKDGVTDSRPTWAPEHVRQIGSSAYVVSYRIIDTSSMMNLNVATGYHESATSPKSTPGDDPGPTYGLYPSDADFLRIIKSMATYIPIPGRPANWRNEVNAVHAHRNLNALPLQPGVLNLKAGADQDRADYTFGDQYGAWHGRQGATTPWGAKYHGYENFKFGVASEMRLRQKGGVVPSSGEDSPLELAMPDVLRINDAAENFYIDADGNTNSSLTVRAASHWTGGWRSATGDGLFASVRPYPSLRNMFTVYSGANDYAPRVLHLSTADPSSYSGDEADDIYKVDLVHRHVTRPANNPTARMQMIQERLYKVFTVGNKNYLNMTDAECQELSIQWALNIVDYSDPDSHPSKWPQAFNGRDFYGLEIMPYLKEFYLQMGYLLEDKMDLSDPCNPQAGTDMMYDTLTLTDNTHAFIVEVGNPYDREIEDMSNFRVILRQGTTQVVVAPLSGTLEAFNPTDLNKGKKVFVLDQNTLDAAEGGLGDDVEAQIVDTGYQFGSKGTLTATTGSLNDLNTDTDIVVELAVKMADGSFVTYDKMVIADFKFPDKYDLASQQAINGAPEYQFFQFAARRAGEVAGSGPDVPPAIGYLSNHQIASTKREADDNSGGFKRNTPFELIGIQDKAITIDPKLLAAKLYIRVPNRRILNVAELGYIFSGGGFSLAAGSQTDLQKSLADTLFGEGGNGLDENGGAAVFSPPEWHFLTLPRSNLPGGSDVPTDTKVPHVAYLFDHFTCLSPGWDGLDANNEIGAKDDQEDVPLAATENTSDADAQLADHFIPGRFNINTAPWFIAAAASPLPESFGLTGSTFWKPNYQFLYINMAYYRDQPHDRHISLITGNWPSGTFRGIGGNQNTTADFGFVSVGEVMLLRRNQGDATNLETATQERDPHSSLLYAASNEPKIPVDDVRKIYPARYNYDELTGAPAASAYTSSNAAGGFQPNNDGPWPVARDHKYREQDRMVRFHFINPTLTVRSDTFIAYFEIRAYSAADFSTGAKQTKSYIALFDRSNIRTTEDTTKLVTWQEQ